MGVLARKVEVGPERAAGALQFVMAGFSACLRFAGCCCGASTPVTTRRSYGGLRSGHAKGTSALPFGRTEASSDILGLDAESSGVGDGYVVLGLMPIVRDRYHIGLSGWLIFPTGEYDSRQLVNQGLNAWSARIEGNWT